MTVDPEQYRIVREQDCTPEIRLLRRVLALRGLPETPPAEEALPDALLQAARPYLLAEVARLNKLTGFLTPYRARLLPFFPDLVRLIDQRRLIALAMNRKRVGLSAAVAANLTRHRIAHLNIKGVLQQQALYDDPYMKPTADADIVVMPQDFARAAKLMEADGFRCEAGTLTPWWRVFLGAQHFERGEDLVDLHYKLQRPGCPGVRRVDKFFRRAVVQTFEGQKFQVPSLSDRCLMAAVSVVKSAYVRDASGNYLADLAAALDRLSVKERADLPRLAKGHGLSETLDYATQCLDALVVPFGAPSRATGPMPVAGLDGGRLCRMVMEPWAPDLDWPRRREMLRALCGPSRLRYANEVISAATSEGVARILLAVQARLRPEMRSKG